METVVLNHPLISHKLAILRNKETGTKEFREIVSEIAMFLCYEAMKNVELEEIEIETPLKKMKIGKFNEDKLCIYTNIKSRNRNARWCYKCCTKCQNRTYRNI